MAGRVLEAIARPASGCGCGRRPAGRRASRHLPLVPVLALALLPKCPFCLAAWLGVLGSVGANSWAFDLYGTPLTLALLGFALVTLGARAATGREVRPLLLGLLGAVVSAAGRCGLESPALTFVGLLVLSAALVWSSRLVCVRSTGT